MRQVKEVSVLVPEVIAGEKILSSICDQETVADYDAQQTYRPHEGEQGDRVVENGLVYEAVREVTGVPPSKGSVATPKSWIEVRSVNELAMWNGVIGDATIGSQPWAVHEGTGIQMEVRPGRIVPGLAIFGMRNVESVRIELIDDIDGIVYDRTINMRSTTGITGYWAYWFSPIQRRRDVMIDDLPSYRGTLRISIQQVGDAPAECGVCVIGPVHRLGYLLYGVGGGVMPFSRKVRDEFGRLLLQEGDVVKTFNYRISVEKHRSDAGVRLLTDLDAKRLVIFGTDLFESSLVYGIYEDFRFTYENVRYHHFTLDAVGLT
ncbi:hypothetical protein RN346_04485 [Halomonas sp. PAMB 3232]|uniref:hypothetical protein n=1 Tax=Halomonas sp. PAMB 3232 TaxID=3075221 RepID=UPI0028A1C2FD|nr:hypothetical protein [Halomonas sp. PAMB 3232]WNL39819.1 hypothetical protein RN346_04485 [Halomonas sp. PAMB 3232]